MAKEYRKLGGFSMVEGVDGGKAWESWGHFLPGYHLFEPPCVVCVV
jgi:hypothetical protein